MRSLLLSSTRPGLFGRSRCRPAAIVCFLAAATSATTHLAAQPDSEMGGGSDVTPSYRIERLQGEITIDGQVDEPAWRRALRIDRFWEWLPGENVAPPVETEVFLTYDDSHLYLAAIAHDPEPDKVRAHLMARDAIDEMVRDDYILLQLDTYNDQRRSFQFRINPLGVQADALNNYVDGGEDWSWDILWTSRGRRTATGYSVEIAIPFAQLAFHATDGEQTWRIAVGRSWPREQRHRMASYVFDYNVNCGSCLHNEVTGFEGLRAGRRLQFVPSLVGDRTDRAAFPGGSLDDGDENSELGLSGNWGISASTRLSFAANPDFSQVEADTAQLGVNERFALFFPEQRPFFLEDTDFFATPLRAVFTRTVVDPDWGVKLTGKRGRGAYGAFVTQDRVNNVVIPFNQGSAFASSEDGLLDEDVLTSVFRYRRDLGENSALGLLYTGREADDYSNQVVGLDGLWRLSGADQINFQYLTSETEYPEELRRQLPLELGGIVGADPTEEPDLLADPSFSGDAWSVRYGHFTRHWNWNLRATRFDETFRADAGFIPRVDTTTLVANLGRRWWFESNRWTNAGIGFNASRTDDRGGDRTDAKIGITADINGPRQSLLWGQVFQLDRSAGGLLFEDQPGAEIFFEIQPTGDLRFALYSSLEETVDFANVRVADQLQVNPSLQMRLGRSVSASLDHFHRALSDDSGTYLQADLSQLRLFYHFNVRSFLRAIVQYTDVTRNPEAFDFTIDPRDRDLFTQLLYSFQLNAQTVLFAGYSDAQVASRQDPFERTERTFFVKLSYAVTL